MIKKNGSNIIDWLDHQIHHKWGYFFLYTVAFSIVSLGAFAWFIIERRSFIWQTDGVLQHFNALMYYGTYLRNISRQLLQGQIVIPLWNFTFGFGADIPTTLHHYVFGDPLTLLSFFIPTRYMEYLYNFLVIFRLYLAGLAYSLYSFKLKKEPWSILIGTLIYVFCGFAFIAIRHPFFLNPLIYLPLLLLGVEKIFKQEKPHLFIVITFLSLLSSLYFFYMLSILLLIYALIRSFHVYHKFSCRFFLRDVMKFSFYYLIGVLMAGVIFLPNAVALLHTDRVSAAHDVSLFYPLTYYQQFIFSFITSAAPGSWTYMGYAAIALIAVIYLVLFAEKKKGHTQLRLGLLILMMILFFPYLGHIMNGLSYVSNRWIWGYSFLIALIVTRLLPLLIKIQSKHVSILSCLIGVYFFIMMIIPDMRSIRNFIAVIMLIMSLFILWIISKWKVQDGVKYLSLLVIVMLNLILLGDSRNSPHMSNYVSTFQTSNTAAFYLQRSPTRSVAHLTNEDFFRVEENHFDTTFVRNSSVQTGVNTSTFFWSMANPYVAQFLDEIHHWAEIGHRFTGVDGRAMLGALTSTRYFIVREGHEAFIPYGYDPFPIGYTRVFADDNQRHHAFLNGHALPLGYTYRQYMSRDQYELLSFVERQQALMQAVLLEDVDSSSDFPLVFNDQLLIYDMELDPDLTFEDQQIHVKRGGATLTLRFETMPHSEIYVNFNNIHFEGDSDRPRIRLENDNIHKHFNIAASDNRWYVGRHHFALNMGYHEEASLIEVTISFYNRGIYTFDSIEVIAQPMDLFPTMVADLSESILGNVEISTNRIDGTIALSEDKILLLTIPFSNGWRAYVNDEPVELMRANTMFMAIRLLEGDHQITLIYRTPFLIEGMIATLIGFSSFGGVVIYFKRKRKNQNDVSPIK